MSENSTKSDAAESAESREAREASIAKLAEAKEAGAFREYLAFLTHTGKWWLLPIVLLLAVAAGLVILASTGAAPFIYALF